MLNMENQIFRMPIKYKELFESMTKEECGKLIIALMNKDYKELEGLTLIYYNMIIVDIDNIENQVKKGKEGGKKGGRPKNEKRGGYENKKGGVIENETQDKISKDKLSKDNISKVKLNKDNNILSKDNTETSSEIVKVDNRNIDINKMESIIKDTVNSFGLIYKKGQQERNRIQNILTGKDFGYICERANMSREDFVINIIELSTKLDFWRGKIYNAETFYKHYAKVYNEAVRIKEERKNPLVC